jgi:hypothetical protein
VSQRLSLLISSDLLRLQIPLVPTHKRGLKRGGNGAGYAPNWEKFRPIIKSLRPARLRLRSLALAKSSIRSIEDTTSKPPTVTNVTNPYANNNNNNNHRRASIPTPSERVAAPTADAAAARKRPLDEMEAAKPPHHKQRHSIATPRSWPALSC